MAFAIAFLALSMLIFGTINTVTTKLQDITVVGTSSKGKLLFFSHPAFQSACMFLGEFACLVPYLCTVMRRKAVKAQAEEGQVPSFRQAQWRRKLVVLGIFSVPALLDSGATTLLNIGLILTYASVFQMLRGTMVVFTGILTVTLLKRKLHYHHWLGIVLISAGAAIVGASSVLSKGSHTHDPEHLKTYHLHWADTLKGRSPGADAARAPLLGDLLIVVAQVLQALQFIIEEKYLAKYRVPALLAVGLEGFWGLVICAIALPILSNVSGSNSLPLDSFRGALDEISHSTALKWATFGSIASIAFYNFFGLSVTKRLSGAGRATIDACRTALVWIVSLSLGWEHFHVLQVLGFLVILSGSSLYNELIRACLPKTALEEETDNEEPLLAGDTEAGLPPLPPSRGRSAPRQAGLRPSQYTMARSLRAGPAALSPRSLASPATSPPVMRQEQ